MQIAISQDAAINMARRLNKAVQAAAPQLGPKGLKHSQSLEMLSHVLGFENWDTFCGLLKAAEAPAEASLSAPPLSGADAQAQADRVGWREAPPALAKPFTFYWEAFACDEWGDSPRWAKLEVTQAFLDQLHEMQTKCLQNGAQMSVYQSPECWDLADDLRLSGDQLNVSQSSFWFSAYPKNCNYSVETRILDIKDFFDVIDQASARMTHLAWADGMLFMDVSSAKSLAQDLVDNGEIDIEESRIEKMPT